MGIQFEVQGTRALQKALQQAGDDAVQLMADALYWEMEMVIADAKTRVPVDTGNLRASGTVLPPVIDGTRIEIEAGFGGSAGSYAIWVHEGRRPHGKLPPREPIADWARRHGIPEEAVFNIQRAIAARGIPASKYLERAVDAAVPGLENRLAARIKAAS